jgi:hypothetical protein
MGIYGWADSSINACPRYAIGFTQLQSVRPYGMPLVERRLCETRLSVIIYVLDEGKDRSTA